MGFEKEDSSSQICEYNKEYVRESCNKHKNLYGLTDEFSITIGVHQGSTLSHFLFVIVMDEITKSIHEDIPWCMLFADDIVLISETKERVNKKLELWRQTLEA